LREFGKKALDFQGIMAYVFSAACGYGDKRCVE